MGNLPPHQNSSLSPDTQWRGRLNCDGNLIQWMVSFQYLDFLSKIKWILQRIYICSRPTCLEYAPPYLPHRWRNFEKRNGFRTRQGSLHLGQSLLLSKPSISKGWSWDRCQCFPSLPAPAEARGHTLPRVVSRLTAGNLFNINNHKK